MIALIVNFTLKPGMEHEAKRLIGLMEEATHKEPGCRAYIGLQSIENPLEFCFYEQYDDQAALDFHWHSPHFSEYVVQGLSALYATRERTLYTVVSAPTTSVRTAAEPQTGEVRSNVLEMKR